MIDKAREHFKMSLQFYPKSNPLLVYYHKLEQDPIKKKEEIGELKKKYFKHWMVKDYWLWQRTTLLVQVGLDEKIISFFVASLDFGSGRRVPIWLFVVNFKFIFLIGQQFWAGHYKIP